MPWCFCSGAALARRLYLRDNNQWLECGCGCEKGDGFGVEQVPHLYFYFPQGGNSVGPFTVTSNGIFYYYSCFGETDSTMNLLCVFSSSTQIVFISLFFCICLLSPFPCPDFPAAKPWDLLSGSLYPNPTSSHGTFPPSLSLPGKARCCKRRLKTPRSLQPFV